MRLPCLYLRWSAVDKLLILNTLLARAASRIGPGFTWFCAVLLRCVTVPSGRYDRVARPARPARGRGQRLAPAMVVFRLGVAGPFRPPYAGLKAPRYTKSSR